jgi:hypothetical protein
MTPEQMLAIKCAYADLLGALQNYEQGSYADHDWDAHKLTINDMEIAFSDILSDMIKEFSTD